MSLAGEGKLGEVLSRALCSDVEGNTVTSGADQVLPEEEDHADSCCEG